jgi:hypothetical protein
LDVLPLFAVDVRKKHCSTEAVEQWHALRQSAGAGSKGMLPARDQPLPTGVKNSSVLNAS